MAVPNHSNITKKELQNFQGLREQTERMWSTGWGLHQIPGAEVSVQTSGHDLSCQTCVPDAFMAAQHQR